MPRGRPYINEWMICFFWMVCILDLFAILMDVYKDYDVKIETINNSETFVIVNPYWDGNILVVNDHDDLIFCFAAYHEHFYDSKYSEYSEYSE